jgi:hypothetical protein
MAAAVAMQGCGGGSGGASSAGPSPPSSPTVSPPPPAATTSTLRQFVGEVATGTYTSVAVGNPSLLNQQVAGKAAGSQKTLFAAALDYVFPRARAQAAPGCLQLVGLKTADTRWEAVALLNSGGNVCALDAFAIGTTHLLITLDNQSVNGKFCNLLVLRRSDGKSFCVLEDAPEQGYKLSARRDSFGSFIYQPVRVSGNGKYVLVNYSNAKSARLMLLDVSNPNTDPVAKIIWGKSNSSASGEAEYVSSLDKYAPTNAGDAVVDYQYRLSTGATARYVDWISVDSLSSNVEDHKAFRMPAEPLAGVNDIGAIVSPTDPTEAGMVIYSMSDYMVRFDKTINSFTWKKIDDVSSLPWVLGTLDGAYVGWKICGATYDHYENNALVGKRIDCAHYSSPSQGEGYRSWWGPPSDGFDNTVEHVALVSTTVGWNGSSSELIALLPTDTKWGAQHAGSFTIPWSQATNRYTVSYTSGKATFVYKSTNINSATGALVVDVESKQAVKVTVPDNHVIDRVEESSLSPGTLHVRGFENMGGKPFTARISSAGAFTDIQYLPVGAFSSSLTVIPIGS